jgi:hypothetical protein
MANISKILSLHQVARTRHQRSSFPVSGRLGVTGIHASISGFTTTGDTLKVPLGYWISPTHHIWKWCYRADTDGLQQIKGNTIFNFNQSSGFRFTQATRKYHLTREEPLSPLVIQGIPTSVTGLSDQQVVKLSKGPALAKSSDETMDFWEFLYSWGGRWMWEGVEAGKDLPYNMSWVAEETNNSLVWVMGYGLLIQKDKGN